MATNGLARSEREEIFDKVVETVALRVVSGQCNDHISPNLGHQFVYKLRQIVTVRYLDRKSVV